MIRVQFGNKKTMQQTEFKAVAHGVVQLTGKDIPKCTGGFQVFRMNGDFLGDYSEYTEIVATVKNGLQFAKPKIKD